MPNPEAKTGRDKGLSYPPESGVGVGVGIRSEEGMDPKDKAAFGSSRPSANLVSITVIPVSTDTLPGGWEWELMFTSSGGRPGGAWEDKEQGLAGDSGGRGGRGGAQSPRDAWDSTLKG